MIILLRVTIMKIKISLIQNRFSVSLCVMSMFRWFSQLLKKDRKMFKYDLLNALTLLHSIFYQNKQMTLKFRVNQKSTRIFY